MGPDVSCECWLFTTVNAGSLNVVNVPSVGDVEGGGSHACVEAGENGNALQCPLNFALSLKCSKRIIFFSFF